jgi:hypothetical protein
MGTNLHRLTAGNSRHDSIPANENQSHRGFVEVTQTPLTLGKSNVNRPEHGLDLLSINSSGGAITTMPMTLPTFGQPQNIQIIMEPKSISSHANALHINEQDDKPDLPGLHTDDVASDIEKILSAIYPSVEPIKLKEIIKNTLDDVTDKDESRPGV